MITITLALWLAAGLIAATLLGVIMSRHGEDSMGTFVLGGMAFGVTSAFLLILCNFEGPAVASIAFLLSWGFISIATVLSR